jgi:hypothetical protein
MTIYIWHEANRIENDMSNNFSSLALVSVARATIKKETYGPIDWWQDRRWVGPSFLDIRNNFLKGWRMKQLVFLPRLHQLIVTANVVPSWKTPVTLMIEALLSSKMALLTKVARRHIPEDGILHSHVLSSVKTNLQLNIRFTIWEYWVLRALYT